MATTGQIQIVGLNNLLRDLRKLDKEAQDELRTASKEIATRLMVPAYQDAADQAGPWGAEIAATVKAARDRIPSVSIGSRARRFSGGASPTTVRYPSNSGRQGRSASPTTAPSLSASPWGACTGSKA